MLTSIFIILAASTLTNLHAASTTTDSWKADCARFGEVTKQEVQYVELTCYVKGSEGQWAQRAQK